TTLTMLGKAENIPPPFGPGGSAELIRTCNTELPSASPPYVMAFANKLTREDSGGQVTLTDTDGACTAKTDAAVTSVDIPDRPAPGNPVAAGIADSDTATVEALNNDNPAATSMNVLLELTHETAVCPEINWDDTSVVVNGSPGVGTVIDTAIVGGQRTQTMLVIAGSLTQLLPVQVLADYDYNCTADGTTDLVLDVVISHTVGGDDPADQFDNLGVDTASADSDLDLDDDTVNNAADNCLNVANTDQANADGDAEGNACDNDADGDGVPNASDDCDVALNATSLPPATGATSITEDYGDKETSDGCADTDATSSQTAIALGPGIGQPGEIPVNDTVQREVTVRFANGDHNANLSNLIQVNSNVNNCVVEMASPTPDIEFTDAGTGAHMEVRDYGSAYFTADDSTPGSGTDEQNVTVTLDITCVAVGSATATIFTHTLPVSPIEEEDLAAPNDTSQVISLTAGADTDGDTIPDSVDDCDPVPEDADAIDDNDGCPDVDAQVINATAGSAMTVYKG
ncbi:MAG: hypothetical protein GTO22_10435, partial [Gemmatimonadales bacterium]|nr:hypothetical protein [Gemmatimonadales bacterium]